MNFSTYFIARFTDVAGIRYGGLPPKVVAQLWPSGTLINNTAQFAYAYMELPTYTINRFWSPQYGGIEQSLLLQHGGKALNGLGLRFIPLHTKNDATKKCHVRNTHFVQTWERMESGVRWEAGYKQISFPMCYLRARFPWLSHWCRPPLCVRVTAVLH